ncbi:MAG: immunoglobulin domain-containing protein [Opitutaceae bacterium]|nr:immunoglobulin domain-containing protein [Opitutaceae bacterium]
MNQFLLLRLHGARMAWVSSLLVLLLQRTPMLRVLASSEFAVGCRLGEMLRALVPVALATGVVNALTGATTIATNPASPATGQVGTSFTMVFALSGAPSATPESYAIIGILPPGLTVPGATGAAGNLTLNASSGSIQGTPTTAGSYTFDLQAFDGPSRSGGTHGSTERFPITIVIEAVESAPSFTQQPASVTANYGAGASFTVAVSGTPAPTLQWRKDGTPITGATTATLALGAVVLGDAGTYDCVATNSVGSATSSSATLTVTPPPSPSIDSQPTAMTSRQGSGAFFSVQASGTAVTYQWRKDGADIAGATQATLFLNNVQPGDAGSYTVALANPGGSVTSNAAALAVVATGSARVANLSTRARVGVGDEVLIPGFVISGTGTKSLLVRAVGPRLGQSPFSVAGVLPDPTMSLMAGSSLVLANDDWGQFADQAALASASTSVFAFSLGSSTKDAAMVVSLAPQLYTVVTSGVGNTTGVALVELYDLDPPSSTSRLVNISARARVGTGSEVLIPGFVIDGDVALTLLVRAVGPTLGNAPFNVAGVLADPVMTVFRGATAIASNDDWQQAPNQAALEAARQATFAFRLGDGQKDAACLIALNPGAYTVQVAGKDGTTGVSLVELYVVGP